MEIEHIVDENEEENVKNLYEEAAMPIEEVMKKFKKLVNEGDEK